MIEIAIHEIHNYDMVQVFEQALAGEQVVLVRDGLKFDVILNQKQMDKDRQLVFDDFFAKTKGKLPKDFKFNREELYDRL